jgi:hypothetical protein
MAATLFFFMAPEDEVAFFRALENRHYELYPEAFDPDYQPLLATAENVAKLTDDSYYMLLPEAGEPVARMLRRGPNAGRMEIDEVGSPVIHIDRSMEIDGELRSGRLWAELVAVGDKTHRERKAAVLQVAFEELRTYFKKRFHHSDPSGFFIGPVAGRRFKEGLPLREAGRKGGLVKPHR